MEVRQVLEAQAGKDWDEKSWSNGRVNHYQWWFNGDLTTYKYYKWDWLVVWNMAGLWLSIQLGMSSSQLTKLHHLSEGLVNHQPVGIVQDATLKIGDEKTIINSQGAVKLPMNAGDIL